MSDQARAFLEAVFEFSTHYAEYVKEMDESLHRRAVDYAKTFTDVEGVEFTYVDQDEEEEEDEWTRGGNNSFVPYIFRDDYIYLHHVKKW